MREIITPQKEEQEAKRNRRINNSSSTQPSSSSFGDSFTWHTEQTLAVHLWNKMTAEKEKDECVQHPLTYPRTTVGKLHAQHCPRSFAKLETDCWF